MEHCTTWSVRLLNALIIDTLSKFINIVIFLSLFLVLTFISITFLQLEKVQAVTGDILKETTNAISKYCNCSFPAGSIASGKLSCRNSPSYVTYRSMIGYGHGHSIEEVLTFIENWVSTSPTIVAGPYIVDIDPSCTIRISSLTDPECPPPEIRTLEDEVLITRNPTAISCINKCGSRSGLVSLTCRD